MFPFYLNRISTGFSSMPNGFGFREGVGLLSYERI